jgi:hypothetical protein
LFGKQGIGKRTNRDIASGERSDHYNVPGMKKGQSRLSSFSGVGKETALPMVLFSLM